jgi:hypothetical protein
MVELETFQGHIVLYCKGHYKIPKDKFFEGLKMIWATRCGYDYELTSKDTLSYIANDMYDIIRQCANDTQLIRLQEQIHSGIGDQSSWKPQNMSPIDAIIWEYRSVISQLQVKERRGKRYRWIIKLPSAKKRIFNRILDGKGEYHDYELINPTLKLTQS